MIIVPSSAVETMGLGALGGLTAFGQGAVAQGAETVEVEQTGPSDDKTTGDPGSGDS
jgi:hypothetical protein